MTAPATRKQKPRSELVPPDTTCNAHTKGKGTKLCSKQAGWGTDHLGYGRCKLHGGSLPNHRENAKRLIAKEGVRAFALPLNIDPKDALLEELHRTAGIIAFYEYQINELAPKGTIADTLTGPVGTEGPTESGAIQTPKTEAHIWIRLHQEEREHYVKIAKVCIDAGIAEREVRIAEAQAAMIAQGIRALLQALNIPLDDPKVRSAIRESMSSITTQARELEPQSASSQRS